MGGGKPGPVHGSPSPSSVFYCRRLVPASASRVAGLLKRWMDDGSGIWGIALFALVHPCHDLARARVAADDRRGYALWCLARHIARDRVRALLERRRLFSAIDDADDDEG